MIKLGDARLQKGQKFIARGSNLTFEAICEIVGIMDSDADGKPTQHALITLNAKDVKSGMMFHLDDYTLIELK